MSNPPRHEFLFDKHGDLSAAARALPTVREHVESLPATAATFTPADIGDIPAHALTDVHMEFLGSWRVPDHYTSGAQRAYVNPNHTHAARYTDLVVECDCGARFTRSYEYEAGWNALRNEHAHTDACKPANRLAARDRMTRMRHATIVRLARMGWQTPDLAPRLAVGADRVRRIAHESDVDLHAERETYRRTVGNTYRHLVGDCDVAAAEAAAICGHHLRTLQSWGRPDTPSASSTEVPADD